MLIITAIEQVQGPAPSFLNIRVAIDRCMVKSERVDSTGTDVGMVTT